MKKIIILKGQDTPKKSFEKDKILKHFDGKALYTNRRELRTYATSNRGELDVVQKQKKIVEQCLFHNINVVIDVLDFPKNSQNKWGRIANDYGAVLEVRELDSDWGDYLPTLLLNA